MTWKMPSKIKEGKQYHLGSRVYREDSWQGIDYAAAHGYDSIDLNGIWTKPDPACVHHAPGIACHGHLMNTHYDEALIHGFHDPQGKLSKHAKVSNMTYDQASRLETRERDRHGNPYRIAPMSRQLKRCKRRGLVASVEAKHRKGWTPHNLVRFMRTAVRAQCPTIVKSMYTYPLVSAKAAGFQTRYTRDHRPGM